MFYPNSNTLSYSNNTYDEFCWPLPNGCNNITYYFGLRQKPTLGASSYHLGLDIAVNERYTNICNYFWNCNLCADLMALVVIL